MKKSIVKNPHVVVSVWLLCIVIESLMLVYNINFIKPAILIEGITLDAGRYAEIIATIIILVIVVVKIHFPIIKIIVGPFKYSSDYHSNLIRFTIGSFGIVILIAVSAALS